jgi:hypothetical protein
LQVGLGVVACADLLRVTERTIRNWEAGAVRIPYAAYKLMRVLRGGRYLAHPVWRDFRVWHDVLVTPEGHRFQAGELAWWSLLVRRARAFSELRAARDAKAGAGEPARPDAEEPGSALGLVYSSTSDPLRLGDSLKTGPAGHLVEAPAPGSLPGLRPVRGPAGKAGPKACRQQQVAGGAA